MKKLTKKEIANLTTMEAACLPYLHYCKDFAQLKRWAKMLEQRAIRFYIEGNLDESVADEDNFDCNIEDMEEEVYEKEHIRRSYQPSLCNIEHSEKHEAEFRAETLKFAKML